MTRLAREARHRVYGRAECGWLRGIIVGAAWLLAAAGCTDTDSLEQVVPRGDRESYAQFVQPYVGLRCGSLDCHGESGRALRLYAEDGLRLRGDLRGEPIAEDEIDHNIASFAGVSPDSSPAAEHLALTKGLAVAAGGFAHVGGDIWTATDDPGYQCLVAWLSNAPLDATAQQACTEAYEQVAFEPYIPEIMSQ